MTKRNLLMVGFIVVLLSMPATSVYALDNDSAVIHKVFTLYEGSGKDPFTIFYPIELKRPGQIKVFARVDNLDPNPGGSFQPLRLIIVDARAFKEIKPSQWKQWLRKANKFNPAEWIAGDKIRKFVRGVKHIFGKKEKKPTYYHGQIVCGAEGKGESIKHAVDAPELRKTGGRYVIIFRNLARMKATGSILITYPGEHWELDREVEEKFSVHPDLVVTNVALNEENQVVVGVANKGRGTLHLVKYHDKGPDAVNLMVRSGGRNHGVTLPGFDPEYKLRRSGGSVSYTFKRLVLKKSAKVTATIDTGNRVIEENEDNNGFSKSIGPTLKVAGFKPAKVISGKPDLIVNAIRLDNGGRVLVEVKNAGSVGLSTALWKNSQKAPWLELKMNGNGWSRVALMGMDPARRLSRPGGVALYNTNYVLRQAAEIDAVIDVTEVISEGNESNNALRTSVRP